MKVMNVNVNQVSMEKIASSILMIARTILASMDTAKMLQTDISASATRDMLEKIATSRYNLVQEITRTIVW